MARERDLGHNDVQYVTMSHLGNLLKAGDFVLGYDLTTINFNDSDTKNLRGRNIPEIVRSPATREVQRALTSA